MFGTKSRCRPRGTIELRRVRSDADANGVVSAQTGRRVRPRDVTERPDGSAYAVAGGPDAIGVLATPTMTEDTWVVLRVQSTVYEGCSTGHWREEWSEPLEVALGSARVRPASTPPQISAAGPWTAHGIQRSGVSIAGRRRQTIELGNLLLPAAFRPREQGNRIVFGPAGPCAVRGSWRLDLVASTAKTATAVLREQGGTDATGTDVTWLRVDGAEAEGLLVVPARVPGTWLVARVDAAGRRPGAQGCRAAHYRTGIAAPLAVALDAAWGDAY